MQIRKYWPHQTLCTRACLDLCQVSHAPHPRGAPFNQITAQLCIKDANQSEREDPRESPPPSLIPLCRSDPVPVSLWSLAELPGVPMFQHLFWSSECLLGREASSRPDPGRNRVAAAGAEAPIRLHPPIILLTIFFNGVVRRRSWWSNAEADTGIDGRVLPLRLRQSFRVRKRDLSAGKARQTHGCQ